MIPETLTSRLTAKAGQWRPMTSNHTDLDCKETTRIRTRQNEGIKLSLRKGMVRSDYAVVLAGAEHGDDVAGAVGGGEGDEIRGN
jgi:hypothetical protein